jgi:ribosome-associated heat shock protein Hsp15
VAASPASEPGGAAPEGRQRLDKWLWFARVVKTRSLAARLVEAGHVRINSQRTDNPAKGVRCNDVLTIALDRQVRVLRVLLPGNRRGPYEEARLLFDDLSEPGAGRPAGDDSD